MYTYTIQNRRLNTSVHSLDQGGVIADYSSPIDLPTIRTGTKVDRYQEKIQQSSDASSDYLLDTYSRSVNDGDHVVHYTYNHIPNVTYSERFRGILSPETQFEHLLTFSDEEGQAALEKMYRKLRRRRTEFEGQEFLGELRQTLFGIRHPLKLLRDQFEVSGKRLLSEKKRISSLAVKHRRKEWQRTVSGTYLEVVFGIMPLISDIDGMVQAAKRIAENKPLKKRLISRSSSSKTLVFPEVEWSYITPANQNYFLQGGTKFESLQTLMQVQYALGFQVGEKLDNSKLSRALDVLGFRADEFIPAIYNCLPYSWALDYFTNVGDLVSAYTIDVQDVSWINRTVTTRTLNTKSVEAKSAAHYIQFMAASGKTYQSQSGKTLGFCATTRTTVDRKVIPKLPLPSLEFTHPSLLSRKWLNLAAVLVQRKQLGDLSWLSRKGPS